jgi:hypothetical protein
MNACQTRRPTRRRNYGSYHETKPVVTDASQNRRNVKRSNYDGDEFDVDSSGDDSVVRNDDEEFGDCDDPLDGELDDDDKEIARSKVSSSRFDNTTLMPPLAIDDWEEDDYEDRVDDWIHNGLSRMTVMKEQDEDETPPGKCIAVAATNFPSELLLLTEIPHLCNDR